MIPNESSSATSYRIAVVQLECHPAFRIGASSYLTEPTADPNMPRLQELAALELPVRDLQQDCRRNYFLWHRARLRAVINWLQALDGETTPDLIVFPEGAIPLEFLDCLRKKLGRKTPDREGGTSSTSYPMILAGTHAFDYSTEGRKVYESLGVKADQLKKIAQLRVDTVSVLPIFFPDGVVELRPKLCLSPMEMTGIGVSLSVNWNDFKSLGRPVVDRKRVKVEPLICAEALQQPSFGRPIDPNSDILVVVSYDRHPDQFGNIIAQYAANQIPVVYCNDGRFGGSRVEISADGRNENWHHSYGELSVLPEGDAIAVFEVHLKNNAPDVAVSNPGLHRRLLKLVPIIPDNQQLTESKVSRSIGNLYSMVNKNIDSGVAIDTESIISELTQLEDSQVPTPVQEIQIQRLRALAQNQAAPINEWIAFADDCRVTTKELAESARVLQRVKLLPEGFVRMHIAGFPLVPKSLKHLERELCERCYQQLGTLLQDSDHKSANVIQRIRRKFGAYLGKRVAGSPTRALEQVLAELRTEAFQVAETHLSSKLGSLIERFRATSGMVFVVETTEELLPPCKVVAVATSNVPILSIERRISPNSSEGVIGLVAYSERGYCNGYVNTDESQTDVLMDKHYKNTNPTTRAEIAVPVFLRNTNGTRVLLGIVNLESCVPGIFTPIQIQQLESEAMSLAVDLQVIQSCRRSDRSAVFHPDVHGWGLKHFLERLTLAIATSNRAGKLPPSVSCSIWNADEEKNRFYVTATSRYDFEYLESAFLPRDSFVGRVFYSRTAVFGGRIDDLHLFRRRRKAERMELSRVLATPFGKQAGREFNICSGVLTLYSFQNEFGGGERELEDSFSDHIMQLLGRRIERIVYELHQQKVLLGGNCLDSFLGSKALPGIDDMQVALNVIMDVMESDGCTLFLKHNEKLQVCATSGLESKARQYSLHRSKKEAYVEEGEQSWTAVKCRTSDLMHEVRVSFDRPLPSGLNPTLVFEEEPNRNWAIVFTADRPVTQSFAQLFSFDHSEIAIGSEMIIKHSPVKPKTYRISGRFPKSARDDNSEWYVLLVALCPRQKVDSKVEFKNVRRQTDGCVTVQLSFGQQADRSPGSNDDIVIVALQFRRIPRVRGLTRFVAASPNRVIRKLDVPDETELCWDNVANRYFRLLPLNLIPESGTVNRSSHRSFIGAAVTLNDKVKGVIRLVRSEESRPFTSEDAMQVTLLAAGMAQLMNFESNRIDEKTEVYNRASRFFGFKLTILKTDHALAASCGRILGCIPRQNWTSRWLRSWLQDLIVVAKSLAVSSTPVFAHVRCAEQDSSFDWHLRMLSYHSTERSYIFDDDDLFPRRRMNIGWTAIDRSESGDLLQRQPQIITFEGRNSKLFDCGIANRPNVASGVCIPMDWISHGDIVHGVVTIDYADPLKPTTQLLRGMFFAALGLTRLSIDASSEAAFDPCINQESWLNQIAREFESVAIFFASNGKNSFMTIPKSQDTHSTLQSTREKLRDLRPDYPRWNPHYRCSLREERLGVRRSERAVLIPLRIGAFKMFDFVGVLSEQRFGTLMEEAQSLTKDLREEKRYPKSQLIDICFRQVMSRFVFNIAETWASVVDSRASFWSIWDVDIYPSVPLDKMSHVGLDCWEARIKKRSK